MFRSALPALVVLAVLSGLIVGTASTSVTAAPGAVTIREPAFGLPHIYADTDAELAREAGRVAAEDRLGQLVLLRRVGRGIAMTVFRNGASKRGVVMAADSAAKVKTVVQDIFLGATIGWFAWRDMRVAFGWETGWLGAFWNRFHGALVAVTLGVAVVLTLYTPLAYVYRYRNLFRGASAVHTGSGDGA